MIITKVCTAIFCALLSPFVILLRWLPAVYNAVVRQEYVYYDADITTLTEFLYRVYGESYLFFACVSLIFIFIPFQLIKDNFLKRGNQLPFIKRLFILFLLTTTILLCAGMFINIWWVPWYKNFLYLVFALVFSLFFNTVIYLIGRKFDIDGK